MNRLRVPAILALLALPLVCAANPPVNFGVVTWIGYGPIYCAAENGYYRKYGLDVKLINFGDNSVMPGALQSGQINAATPTYDQVIASNARGGWKLKVVSPVNTTLEGVAGIMAGGSTEVEQQRPNVENPAFANLGDVFKREAVLASFYASGKIISDILRREGQIDSAPPIDATYDARFVGAVQARPGG